MLQQFSSRNRVGDSEHSNCRRDSVALTLNAPLAGFSKLPTCILLGPTSACVFQAGKLLTSWIGYGLNYLRYKLSMDNSLSGSR